MSGQSRGSPDGRPAPESRLRDRGRRGGLPIPVPWSCGSAATALPPSQKLASDARLATMLQKAAAPQPHSRAGFARRKCPDSRVPQGRAAPLPSVGHAAHPGRLQSAITQSATGNGMGGPAWRDRHGRPVPIQSGRAAFLEGPERRRRSLKPAGSRSAGKQKFAKRVP